MERLTEKHYAEKGYYMKCSETCCKLSNCDICDGMADIVDRLAEYEDAEESGLLIRLPCKVGTPCWKVWQFGGEFGVTDWVFDYDDISQFGITVFLTREEAEAELAKEKHDET